MAIEHMERPAAFTADVTIQMSWGEALLLQVLLTRAIRVNAEHGAPVAVHKRVLANVERSLYSNLERAK